MGAPLRNFEEGFVEQRFEEGGDEKPKFVIERPGHFGFVDPSIQYSRNVFEASGKLVRFSAENWLKEGRVQMVPIGRPEGQLAAGLVVRKPPLTDGEITELITGTGAAELAPGIEFGVSVNRRLSWAECESILARWAQKRLGGAPR